MPRDAFVLKIQGELCQPKHARNVSGFSRNGAQAFNMAWICFCLKTQGESALAFGPFTLICQNIRTRPQKLRKVIPVFRLQFSVQVLVEWTRSVITTPIVIFPNKYQLWPQKTKLMPSWAEGKEERHFVMLIKVDLRSKKSFLRRTYQRMCKSRQTKLGNFWVHLQDRYLREIISAYFRLSVYERDWRHTQRRQVVVLLAHILRQAETVRGS